MLRFFEAGKHNATMRSFDLEAYRRDGVQLIKDCLDENHILELNRIGSNWSSLSKSS
jgi:hypothetical protein